MDRIKQTDNYSRGKTQSIIERGSQIFLDKFSQIDQIFQKLESEEMGAREKLRRVLQDLNEEVSQAEQKHKKIQDFLKSFKDS